MLGEGPVLLVRAQFVILKSAFGN